MTQELIKMIVTSLRANRYSGNDEWGTRHALSVRAVDLQALLNQLDSEFARQGEERIALDTLIRCVRTERPEAVPYFLFRLVELTKQLQYEYELPEFLTNVFEHLDALPTIMRQPLVLDLFIYFRRVCESNGTWWYSLSLRDVTKLLLSLPPVKSPHIYSVAGEMPHETCSKMRWDIPYVDLLILFGFLERDPVFWRDALERVFPFLHGGNRAVEDVNRILDGGRYARRTPKIAPFEDKASFERKMQIAGDLENVTRAAFALRIVTHFAASDGYQYNLAAERLAQVVFPALNKNGPPAWSMQWAQLPKPKKAELARAMESSNASDAAKILGMEVPDDTLLAVTKAGFSGSGPLSLQQRLIRS